MSFHRLALLSTALLVPACLADGEPSPVSFDELVDVEDRCIGCGWGPPVLNTHGLNGLAVAALDTSGVMYDGWRLISVEVLVDRAPRPVYDVYVEDGAAFGIDAYGTTYDGKDFIGSSWTVELAATGQTVVMQAVDFKDDEPARYSFIGGGGSTPNGDKGFTCPQDPETGEYSVVLFRDLDVDAASGTHFGRERTIYFGCVSGAVGKAALWGYSPWEAGDVGHQAATRTVRADYCGDGTSYTLQGTPLQLTDVFHINEFADPYKDTEAMWGPGGAHCIKAPRLGLPLEEIVCGGGTTLPICDSTDELEDWPGTVLWTKIW
jgi:hypothetical protein